MASLFRALRTILLSSILLVLAIVLLVWLQGDRMMRGLIERELQARLALTVVVEGPVAWTLSTTPALSIANMRFVESGRPVMALSSVVVGADLKALLDGRIVLDSVEIEGLDLHLWHFEDGRLNVATWLREDGSGESPDGMAFSAGRLRISDLRAQIGEDLMIRVDVFDAGPIRPGELGEFAIDATVTDLSAMDLELQLSAGGMFDPVARQLQSVTVAFRGRLEDRYDLSGDIGIARVEFETDGGLRTDNIIGKLVLTERTQVSALLDLHAEADSFSGTSGTYRAQGLDVAARLQHEDRGGELQLSVDAVVVNGGEWEAPGFVLHAASQGALSPVRAALSGGAEGDLSGSVRMTITQSDLGLPHPAGASKPIGVSLIGELRLDVSPAKVFGDISGTFDDSRFEGNLSYEHGRVPPISVQLSLDRIDIDRYLPPPAQGQARTDFAIWRNWPVSADLAVGELRVQGFLSRDARLRLNGGDPVQQDVQPLPEGFSVAP